jgi:RNA polymerase sigma-70 factor (ECF subfamily)
MSPSELNTTYLHVLVDRFRHGDRDAADQLIRAALERMKVLAHQWLQRSPIVRRWADADDVLQNALLRLHRALLEVRPESTRAFFAIAAEMIRRELIDLARQLRGAHGLAANHESHPDHSDPPAPAEPADELLQWQAFHEAVCCLDAELAEVFRFRYYHELTREEIAAILGVDEKTVQRRYRRACEKLAPHLERWLREHASPNRG